MPNKDLMKELVIRTEAVRDMQQEIDEQNKRIEVLKEEIRQQFLDEGIGSTTVVDPDGTKRATVYTSTMRAPSVADREKFIEFTRKHKLGHLFSVNPKTLQGFVNHELKDIDPAAYDNMQSIGLECFEIKTLTVRKA